MLTTLIVVGVILVVALMLPFLIPLDQYGDPPETLADPDGRFITVDDVRLYVREHGVGVPLLAIHGLFGSSESWRYNRDTLAAAGFRLIAYDRPGCALSDKPTDISYSARSGARFAAGLLAALDIEDAVIMGHSAGAEVACWLALDAPERVRGLVLIDPAVGALHPPPFLTPLLGFPPMFRWLRLISRVYITRRTFIQTLNRFQHDASFLTDADYDSYLRQFRAPRWDAGFIALTRDLPLERLSLDELGEIAIPVLLMHGERDSVVTLAAAQTIAAAFPQASLITYPNTGHQPMEEAAAAFNADLLVWLKAL